MEIIGDSVEHLAHPFNGIDDFTDLLNDSFTVEIDSVLDVDELLIPLFELVDRSPVLVVRPIGDFTRLPDLSIDKFSSCFGLDSKPFFLGSLTPVVC